MVSEKICFHIFHIISLCKIMMPRGVANLGPRDKVGRIYEGGYLTFIDTHKIFKLWVSWFQIFLRFSPL